MNPVGALWMEQDAVFCTRGTTQGNRGRKDEDANQ